ncbi:MAG: L7Ae/L30e/S12e/Gadd45 family ribosomal protein [Bacillota bacterium]
MAGSVLNMIGLARRAGHVESGDAAVRSAVDRGKVILLILAEDAAERTRRAFGRLAGDAGIPLISCGTKEDLGKILKKPARSVVAITDKNFARGIVGALERGGAKLGQ